MLTMDEFERKEVESGEARGAHRGISGCGTPGTRREANHRVITCNKLKLQLSLIDINGRK